MSVLGEWEIYSSIEQQHKPVDLSTSQGASIYSRNRWIGCRPDKGAWTGFDSGFRDGKIPTQPRANSMNDGNN
jgi:hypothetical protein